LADRISAVRDGHVRLSYAARAGVCGNGRNIQTSWSTSDWESDCEPGPVRVALDLREGRVVEVRTYVGGRWRPRAEPVVDLGYVRAGEAAGYLLGVARKGTGHGGSDAILAATLADSVVVWPQLLDLAKEESVPAETRRSAVFWLGQAAGEAAVEGLTGLIGAQDQDVAIKEQAIFALSQLGHGGGVEPLIRVARSNGDPRLRKKAIFWLGQSNDPRALALFEELLTKR
jgi:hypothetical protein